MADARFLSEDDDSAKDAASLWVVRLDRGLNPAEEQELADWLREPRHAAAFEQARQTWHRYIDLSSLARKLEPPAPAQPATALRRWAALGGMAAALALGLWTYSQQEPTPTVNSTAPATPVRQAAAEPVMRLTDGSVAKLRDAATLTPAFSPAERKVAFTRGEAFFVVAKDPTRPFSVSIQDEVSVLAVGTAFSVRADADEIHVLVSEGIVRVTSRLGEDRTLTASQSATVKRSTGKAAIEALSAAQVASRLAWTDTMTSFDGDTLAEVAERFSRHRGVRVEIRDPKLAAVRIGGQLPSEDVEGFLHALKVVYNVHADRTADGRILLHVQAPE
jgi:transmembrane sensor